MLLGATLQTAYVTSDLDQACALIGDKYGVSQFYRPPEYVIEFDAGGYMKALMAHALVGPTWLEIIQPTGGQDAVYADHLPADGFGLRFHHIGVRVADPADWERKAAEAQAAGRTKLFSVSSPTTLISYYDTLRDLGHFTEYLYIPDIPTSTLAKMPQNIPGYVLSLEDVGLR